MSLILIILVLISSLITIFLISERYSNDFKSQDRTSFLREVTILDLKGNNNLTNLFKSEKNVKQTLQSFYFNNESNTFFILQLPIKKNGFRLLINSKALNKSKIGQISLHNRNNNLSIEIIFYKELSIIFRKETFSKEIKVFDFLEFDVYEIFNISFTKDTLIIQNKKNYIEKNIEIIGTHFKYEDLSLLSFSSNLIIKSISIFTYLDIINKNKIELSFPEFIKKNAKIILKKQLFDGSFPSGLDAYGIEENIFIATSMNLVKMYQYYELTKNISVIPYINKTIEFLITEGEKYKDNFGYSYNNGGPIINGVARPLFGLVYVGIKELRNDRDNFPQLFPFVDKFVLSKVYDGISHSWKNFLSSDEIIVNQQLQTSTVLYLWAKERGFIITSNNHYDLLKNFLIPSQNGDGSWFYTTKTRIEDSLKPLFLVYVLHNIFNLATMKFFFPDDTIWENNQIINMLQKVIRFLENIIPSFAYYGNYFRNFHSFNHEKNENSTCGSEPHHILALASLKYFEEYLQSSNIYKWAMTAFFDTFVTLNDNSIEVFGKISDNNLSDALAYRWFLFNDYLEDFDVFI